MKNISKLTLTAATVFTLTFSAFSQKAIKKADEAFNNKQYYLAVTLYKQAYSNANNDAKPMILYKTGVASQEINDYKGAESYFQKAISSNYDNPIVYFKLAQVLKNEQKYPEAITEFNNYRAKGGDAKKADLGVKSCELAQKWKDNPLRYKIENMSLINSKGRDYAPSYSDKNYKILVITSNREGSLGTQNINTGTNHSDIYETKIDKNGKWSSPVLLPPSVSTPVNEGQAWVSKKGDLLFYTRCPEEKDKQNKCGLYMAKKQGSTWGEGVLLPFNNDTVQFGHPCLSADSKILYFASRMSGGYGGLDIWSCTFDVKSNSWGQPKNAGPSVNTEGNEMYPTVSDDGKRLYFSSDYHPGMGGLDIFVAESGADGKFTKQVENLKSPINSSFDDFSIIFEGKKQRGFFTSNREGGKGDDDIWSFNLPPLIFSCSGCVVSEGDPISRKGIGEPVEGAQVKIIGSDGSISEITTAKDGLYSFKLKEKSTYTITIGTGKSTKSATFAKEGYLANKDQRVFSTIGQDESKEFKATCFVAKPVIPNLRMPEIQYALGSAELLPQSKDSLIFLYNILKDNPTIVCELNSHTDSRGKLDKNMILSQNRAQSCVDFLVKEKGIPTTRLVAKGFGPTQLLISDAVINAAPTKEEKEALHQKNRRTTFKVLNFDYVDPNAPKTPTKGPAKNKADDDEEE